MKETNYCLWLGLEKSLETEFQTLINRLAARYATQAFIPHATLLTHIRSPLDKIQELAKQLAETTHKLEINSLGLASTGEYYRNFFIQLPLTDQLDILHSDSKKLFQSPASDLYQPHVSLLYGQLSENEKAELKNELKGNYSAVLQFDQLIVCDASSDVCNWGVMQRTNLGG